MLGDYTVSIDGSLVAGAGSELTLTVTRRGRPVTDLRPFLGAYATRSRYAAGTWPTCTGTTKARPVTA